MPAQIKKPLPAQGYKGQLRTARANAERLFNKNRQCGFFFHGFSYCLEWRAGVVSGIGEQRVSWADEPVVYEPMADTSKSSSNLQVCSNL